MSNNYNTRANQRRNHRSPDLDDDTETKRTAHQAPVILTTATYGYWLNHFQDLALNEGLWAYMKDDKIWAAVVSSLVHAEEAYWAHNLLDFENGKLKV